MLQLIPAVDRTWCGSLAFHTTDYGRPWQQMTDEDRHAPSSHFVVWGSEGWGVVMLGISRAG
jgi:hypothetical protein